MESNPLVGTWRLVSWENRSVVDGEVIYPLGEDAVGYIMYGQVAGNRLILSTRPTLFGGVRRTAYLIPRGGRRMSLGRTERR